MEFHNEPISAHTWSRKVSLLSSSYFRWISECAINAVFFYIRSHVLPSSQTDIKGLQIGFSSAEHPPRVRKFLISLFRVPWHSWQTSKSLSTNDRKRKHWARFNTHSRNLFTITRPDPVWNKFAQFVSTIWYSAVQINNWEAALKKTLSRWPLRFRIREAWIFDF